MSCGYTLIESGGVRSQNAGHSLFKSLLILSKRRTSFISGGINYLQLISVCSALAYWIVGYPFAFGGNGNVILGTRFWASEQFGARALPPGIENHTNNNNIYQLNNQDPYIHFFYHFSLAFLVTNIAASAFAERCCVLAYILFSILMTGTLLKRVYS